jgi:hypothetical protein
MAATVSPARAKVSCIFAPCAVVSNTRWFVCCAIAAAYEEAHGEDSGAAGGRLSMKQMRIDFTFEDMGLALKGSGRKVHHFGLYPVDWLTLFHWSMQVLAGVTGEILHGRVTAVMVLILPVRLRNRHLVHQSNSEPNVFSCVRRAPRAPARRPS